MRVVGGQFKKLKLNMVDSKKTRPTTDKVKESLFNILMPYLTNGEVLDLYAGSGALGIEAVSRGYSHAYLVDLAKPAIETIQKNVDATHSPESFSIIKSTAAQAIERLKKDYVKLDLVLLDPPYAKQQIIKDIAALLENNLLSDDSIIVAETDEHGFNSVNQNYDKEHFEVVTTRNFSISYITVFRRIK
ncbi:MAG: 16S rRNA (guanine(966)-N(2))-methyltransferase RsmD [Lactobacillaceae bacterium]|jgi:16S rRNA (guanine966-N2)-methyltransferase|nr:16S rRNA (guanine(966)-N(2))-methyltransferase RsmD [Lactobacillaceae bacterium]